MQVAKLNRFVSLACGLVLASSPSLSHAQESSPSIDQAQTIREELEELRAMKKDLARRMQTFDARIDELEEKMQSPLRKRRREAERKPPVRPTPSENAPALRTAVTDSDPPVLTTAAADPPPSGAQPAPQTAPPPSGEPAERDLWGRYEPGVGFVAIRGANGEISIGLITYLRYLNQLALERTFTDSFGRTKTLDLRNDFLLNKVNLAFKGWLLDPDFTYRVWIWTQNPAMGLGAQVVVGGHMTYSFADWFNLSGGVAPLPTTRTTNWTYPFWLKMDNRTIADEFFRGSYSFGIWADGEFTDELEYRVMLANNLSALGVDAGQLDADFSTVSAHLWWMPTTGEYGVAEGFGDFENHEEAATRFGVHYTRSREDAQSQPNEDDFENTQIRLSDGTLLFSDDPFATGGQVRKATYQMVAANAGIKYQGLAFEAEYYWRRVDEFKTIGFIPVDNLSDHGFSAYASAMVVPRQLQLYAAGSYIFGEYGEPWDITLGLNWYPFSRREIRFNAEGIYLERSPVGGNSYPYLVGGDGWLFNTDLIIAF